MRKKFNKLFCIILMLLLCCSFSTAAFAASPVSVSLEVSTVLSGTQTESETFEFVLTSLDTGDEFFTTVDGAGTARFDRLTFNQVGVYKYTVRQTQGVNPNCTYDSTIYYVTISVFNGHDGYDFRMSATVYKDGADEKQDSIVFENIYKTVTTEPTEPTEPDTTVPSSVSEETSNITQEASTSVTNNNPNTGDNSGLQMWVVLFAVGFIFVVGALIILAPKKKDSEDTL